MIRHPVWVLVFLGCTGVVAAEPLPSDHKISAPPGCLYQSKSYSDGAFICVQKSLMLNCTSDGTRPTWKIVAERDLAERCVGPTVLTYPPARRRCRRGRCEMLHFQRQALLRIGTSSLSIDLTAPQPATYSQ